jgi:hypothetical protein
MAKDEPVEGMYTLVGDPDDPDLEEAGKEKLSLTDRLRRMTIRTAAETYEPTEEEREIADRAFEKARRVASQITPSRVALASIFMAALMFSLFALGFWVAPRDAVTVEVVYKQGGPGHVVLVQVHNYGSRPIANVEVDITFTDAQGNLLNSSHFAKASVAAHTSIAGDDLELVVTGVSKWELYTIEITLDYDNYDGALPEQIWTLEVGEYTFEKHELDADRTWL